MSLTGFEPTVSGSNRSSSVLQTARKLGPSMLKGFVNTEELHVLIQLDHQVVPISCTHFGAIEMQIQLY
jgi:hypothetical protein